MSKHLRRAVLALLPLIWTLSAQAQTPPVRIGVVDLDRLITNSDAGKKLIAPLDQKLKEKRDEAQKMEKALNDLRTKAEKESMTANEKQRRAWQREFEEKLQEMRQFDQEAGRELDRARAETVGEFMRQAMPVLQSLAKEQGYNLILRKEGATVLYADDQADLTPRLVEQLNKTAK